MKKAILILTACSLFILSCKKNNTPVIDIDEMVDTTAQVELSGIFMDGPYGSVTGGAKLYKENDTFTLQLLNVTISNGPDLHVYISKEVQPVNFIDLGKLKSTMGNQVYEIPGNPDFAEYKYALVHCKQYNHLFGSAILGQ